MTQLDEAEQIYRGTNGPKQVPVVEDKFSHQANNELTDLENESEMKSQIQTEMDDQDESDQQKNNLNEFDQSQIKEKLDKMGNSSKIDQLIKSSFAERNQQKTRIQEEKDEEQDERLNQEQIEIEFEKATEETINKTMKLNEQNEQQFLASMKPISLLLKKAKDVDVTDPVKKESTWKDPFPNVVGEFKGGKYVIDHETSTIETKVNETLNDKEKDVNYGNPEASHAKLEEKKKQTYFVPTIKYKNEENATIIETTAQAVAQAPVLTNKTNPVMLNEKKRLHFNFGSETEQYEASLETKIRQIGGYHDLPSSAAEILAAEKMTKKEKQLKKENLKSESKITPHEQ